MRQYPRRNEEQASAAEGGSQEILGSFIDGVQHHGAGKEVGEAACCGRAGRGSCNSSAWLPMGRSSLQQAIQETATMHLTPYCVLCPRRKSPRRESTPGCSW